MLLRKFYVQENEKAPVPHTKKVRELKYNIETMSYKHYVQSLEEFIQVYGKENKEIYINS